MEQKTGTNGIAGLKKYDVRVTGIVFMLYCLVGAGAFGIEEMIPEAGPGMTLILLMTFPVIWALPISNLVAECGAVLPSEGGVYVWVKEAFGEFWGFQAGWWGTVSTYIANGTYVSLVAGYVSQLVPMSPLADQTLKFGMVLIFTVINLLGIKEVEKVSTTLSIMILLAFLLVAAVGFINWETNPMVPVVPPDYNILDGLSGGICICIWMYCGYECISNMAGEVKNPQVIPKGLLLAMPLVALTYILPTLSGIASMPEGSWVNWSTEGGFSGDNIGYATILTSHLGQVWGYIFLVISIIAQCAIFNTYLASGSRGFFVLADDRLCPQFLVRVSRKRGVPYVGILSLAVVTIILAQSDFTTLVNIEVVFILTLYIILAIAVIELRRKYPVEDRRARGLYVMPGGRPGLIFFAGMPLLISVVALLVNGTDYLFIGLAATATGPIAYIIVKRIYGGMFSIAPEKYPLNKKTKLAFGDTLRIGIYMMVTGLFSFTGQIWLRWYEVDYGEWGPDDYDMFGKYIPDILDGLKWGGIILLAAGIILALASRKIERSEFRL